MQMTRGRCDQHLRISNPRPTFGYSLQIFKLSSAGQGGHTGAISNFLNVSTEALAHLHAQKLSLYTFVKMIKRFNEGIYLQSTSRTLQKRSRHGM